MSEDIQESEAEGENPAATPENAETAPPMNRAERRALANGKKGAGGSSFNSFNNGGGFGNRGSSPAGQRIQSRGASRGK